MWVAYQLRYLYIYPKITIESKAKIDKCYNWDAKENEDQD